MYRKSIPYNRNDEEDRPTLKTAGLSPRYGVSKATSPRIGGQFGEAELLSDSRVSAMTNPPILYPLRWSALSKSELERNDERMSEKNDVDWIPVGFVRRSEIRFNQPRNKLVHRFDEVPFSLIGGINDSFEAMAAIRLRKDRRHAYREVAEAARRAVVSLRRGVARELGAADFGHMGRFETNVWSPPLKPCK